MVFFFSVKFISDPEGHLQVKIVSPWIFVLSVYSLKEALLGEELQNPNNFNAFFPGFSDLTNKQVVTSLISLYAQVVIWFCRSSLLPEGLGKQNL